MHAAARDKNPRFILNALGLCCTHREVPYAIERTHDEKVKVALDREGISIPYQQRDVHLIGADEGDKK